MIRARPEALADLGDLLSRMQVLQSIASLPDFETLMIGFKRAHRIVEKEHLCTFQGGGTGGYGNNFVVVQCYDNNTNKNWKNEDFVIMCHGLHQEPN